MSEIKQANSIEDLFNASIEDLADLPSYETPPAGAYILRVSMDVKKINEKDAVEAAFEVIETQELANPSDTPVLAGTKFSQAFLIGNEYGLGNLKKFLAPFQEHYQSANIGALIGEIKDVTIAGTVKTRKDKNDPDKVYGSVVNIAVM